MPASSSQPTSKKQPAAGSIPEFPWCSPSDRRRPRRHQRLINKTRPQRSSPTHSTMLTLSLPPCSPWSGCPQHLRRIPMNHKNERKLPIVYGANSSELGCNKHFVIQGRDAAPPGSHFCGEAAFASSRDAASRLKLGPCGTMALPWNAARQLLGGSASSPDPFSNHGGRGIAFRHNSRKNHSIRSLR